MKHFDSIAAMAPFLGDIQGLTHTATSSGKSYVEPALKNLGAICIPIIREVISPASFRNEAAEVTDITVRGVRRVRAVANKFKYGERRRGLQILRLFGAGGAMALNRTEFDVADRASKGYDLNSLVFGDSANRGKFVLPVKAAAQYSDAVSIAPYAKCVDATFHNKSAEDGTLWDAVDKKNSSNLFDRHFVRPGSLLLQVLTLNGRIMPAEGLLHLLTCVGLAGAYGGQTSVYGVNVRNHVVGIYGAKMERAAASPYEAIEELGEDGRNRAAAATADAVTLLGQLYARSYSTAIDAAATKALVDSLVDSVERADASMAASYKTAHRTVGEFFDAWFGVPSSKPLKGGDPQAEEAA